MNKLCKKCGASLNENDVFCTKCGTIVKKEYNIASDIAIFLGGIIFIIILFWLGIKFKITFLIVGSILSFIFWIIFGIAGIVSIVDNKKYKLKEREYNQKYLSDFVYNNDKIGKIIFQKDDNKNTLVFTGTINNLYFNNNEINIDIDVQQDSNINKIINNLIFFCNNSSKLMDRIYSEFTEQLKKYDNYDKDGNLIDITEHFLRENLKFTSLEINFYINDIENQIGIYCYWEDNGNQDYIIIYGRRFRIMKIREISTGDDAEKVVDSVTAILCGETKEIIAWKKGADGEINQPDGLRESTELKNGTIAHRIGMDYDSPIGIISMMIGDFVYGPVIANISEETLSQMAFELILDNVSPAEIRNITTALKEQFPNWEDLDDDLTRVLCVCYAEEKILKKAQEWKEESAWTEYYDKSRIAGDAIHHTLNYLEELKKQKGR